MSKESGPTTPSSNFFRAARDGESLSPPAEALRTPTVREGAFLRWRSAPQDNSPEIGRARRADERDSQNRRLSKCINRADPSVPLRKNPSRKNHFQRNWRRWSFEKAAAGAKMTKRTELHAWLNEFRYASILSVPVIPVIPTDEPMTNERRGYRIPSLAITILLCACQRKQPVSLIDTLGAPIANGILDQGISVWRDPADPRESVPIIVVASVEENQVVASHVEAARYKGVFLDLHSVRCKRENSLKGGLSEQELRFFYFADGRPPGSDAKPNPLYKRLFKAESGSRYLFFLTRDGDVLRSIGDVGDYSLRIATGRHSERPTRTEEIGKRMAEILLTPADGADLDLMANTLLRSSEFADSWGSRPFTVQLLRQLLPLGEPIRSEACGVLVARYAGQYDCLRALADDTNEAARYRQEASKELNEKSAERERLSEDLKDPAALTFMDFAGDSRHRLREELETLLFNEDKTQHQRACIALRRYFPRDPQPRCIGAGGQPE